MSESGFREVQLSGKQVVFLFMAGVVVAVAVFLLGVSVGRGVTGSAAPAQTPAAASVDPAGGVPPAASPKPGELQYHETLQGRGADQKPVTPPPATPAPTPAAAATPPPAKPSPTPTPTPAAASQKPANAVWYVQVSAFSSRDNAAKEVAQLKAKGYSAAIVTVGNSGARFKVRVGPLERTAADAMEAKLRREGFKPSVIR